MSKVPEKYHLALKKFEEEDYDTAILLLHAALEENTECLDIYEALCLIYFKINNLELAVKIAKEWIGQAPENIMAHTNLSRFYAAQGLLDEAEVEQAEARRLGWKEELAKKRELGEETRSDEEIESEKSRDLERRIETYKQVIEIDPTDVLGYFSLGTAYLDGKMYGLARETLEKAIEVNPNHSPSFLGYGKALESLGRIEDAIEAYEQGIPAADKAGDLIPLQKMKVRIDKLKQGQKGL